MSQSTSQSPSSQQKGHLRQSYKGTRSPKQDFLTTKTFPEVTVQPLEYTDNDKTDEFPHDHGFKTEHIFLKLYNASEKIYSDQIGRFTITSSKGSKYVMIIYEYDSNHIHGQRIKPCNASDLTTAYEKVHEIVTSRGLKPQLHILDN